ncbi:MAG: hypothetical protein KJ731_16475 [Alphaproteobacteria bacterium]|uniref:Uncharacterized protein n=1 Tax=Celeribacter baekdonensis TaxID=875171 RepID=A0A1G7SL54_9RHOB|nr:hypothetical protein [Celeribacter baekdonensis]MBU0644649.1 hypothetical protein [Alphaproteobacteria bacterium]MBU1280808.1 hypothetical protein [Alphaproteobacteria bacterium]MBU1575232.1 hypothetical protein [Alphaproteobacteria bacterium]MBU1830044.1 hypothetical protein [Alphaproteobacteria bacterium]MBU2076710.1 hypothetical protein [Alphaproteobacteria bacterium]
MTGQSRSIQDILMDRLKVTQDIAAANVEHMRLNQKASGMMVLDMKDEEDGVVDKDREVARRQNEAALERSADRINALEGRLSALDAEIDTVMKKEN